MLERSAGFAVVACTLAVAPATGVAHSGTSHPPTLVFNRSVSSIRIGESRSGVVRDWGKGKFYNTYAMAEKGDTASAREYRYAVRGGYLGVAFYGGRVVAIEVRSPRFRTSDGIRVGRRIPNGKQLTVDGHAFYYAAYEDGNSCDCWHTKFLSRPLVHPSSRAFARWVARLKQTRVTYLFVSKGIVVYVWVTRGDAGR